MHGPWWFTKIEYLIMIARRLLLFIVNNKTCNKKQHPIPKKIQKNNIFNTFRSPRTVHSPPAAIDQSPPV
jgi:hypothetical protein